MTPREAIPKDWLDSLSSGPIGLGMDVGTTEKGTSNPSSLAVMQHASPLYIVRLLLAWKTNDEAVSRAIIALVVDDIFKKNLRPRRMCIDASNEVFFAQAVRRDLSGRLPVSLIKSGERVTWKGLEYNYKTLLGNLYVALFEENLIAIPNPQWISDDHRLVKREKGSFVADLGEAGEHGDTFDAGKLAYWALESGRGPFTVAAAAVGSFDGPPDDRRHPALDALRKRFGLGRAKVLST